MNFEDKFTEILLEREELLRDRYKLYNVLLDILYGSHLEANLIAFAFDTGIVAAIEDTNKLDRNFKYDYVTRVCNEFGVEKEKADWAVSLWCFSYGYKILNKPLKLSNILELDFMDGNKLGNYINENLKIYRNTSCSFLYCYDLKLHGIVITNFLTKHKKIKLPSKINNIPVVAIGKKAFANRNDLDKISIPNTIRIIGKKAFFQTPIEEIVIPESVRVIGEKAFGFCKNLVYVKVHDGLEEIEDYAFSECNKLKHIELPYTVKNIGEFAFESFLDANKSKIIMRKEPEEL